MRRSAHFTNDHHVVNRAIWSRVPGRSDALGPAHHHALVPSEATIVLGAGDTVEHRSGRKIAAKGRYHDAVRSTKKPDIQCFELKWAAMMLAPLSWRWRALALPFLIALCGPAEQSGRPAQDGYRWGNAAYDETRQPVVTGPPAAVSVVEGGSATVSLVLACVKPQVVMALRLRSDAALYHPSYVYRHATRGPKPSRGSAIGAWKAGQSARIFHGKPWRWTGTEGSGNSSEASRIRPCSTSSKLLPSGPSVCIGRRSRGQAADRGLFLCATAMRIQCRSCHG